MEQAKAKYWVGILWCESMRPDWKDIIELTLQLPFEYIVHNRDINGHGDFKKEHVHLMIAFPNTTTENHCKTLFNMLSAPGCTCCNRVYRVIGVKYMDQYFTHSTPEAIKQKKVLYDDSEKVLGLGWNTESFNQSFIQDKYAAVIEISKFIIEHGITNYADLFEEIVSFFDMSYMEILLGYSGHFDRVVKGVWQKQQANKQE